MTKSQIKRAAKAISLLTTDIFDVPTGQLRDDVRFYTKSLSNNLLNDRYSLDRCRELAITDLLNHILGDK